MNFDPQKFNQEPDVRTAEIAVNELAALYPEVTDDIAFEVRELFDHEMRAILTLQDDDPLVKALHEALGAPSDLDLRHRVAIVTIGCLNPVIDDAFATRLARDFRPILHRLSDAILELSAQRAGFDDLASMPRIH